MSDHPAGANRRRPADELADARAVVIGTVPCPRPACRARVGEPCHDHRGAVISRVHQQRTDAWNRLRRPQPAAPYFESGSPDDPALGVTCPYDACGAAPGVPCRVPNTGRIRGPHSSRRHLVRPDSEPEQAAPPPDWVREYRKRKGGAM